MFSRRRFAPPLLNSPKRRISRGFGSRQQRAETQNAMNGVGQPGQIPASITEPPPEPVPQRLPEPVPQRLPEPLPEPFPEPLPEPLPEPVPQPRSPGMKKGGKVSSASKRADGCATRGKTKGKML